MKGAQNSHKWAVFSYFLCNFSQKCLLGLDKTLKVCYNTFKFRNGNQTRRMSWNGSKTCSAASLSTPPPSPPSNATLTASSPPWKWHFSKRAEWLRSRWTRSAPPKPKSCFSPANPTSLSHPKNKHPHCWVLFLLF